MNAWKIRVRLIKEKLRSERYWDEWKNEEVTVRLWCYGGWWRSEERKRMNENWEETKEGTVKKCELVWVFI